MQTINNNIFFFNLTNFSKLLFLKLGNHEKIKTTIQIEIYVIKELNKKMIVTL